MPNFSDILGGARPEVDLSGLDPQTLLGLGQMQQRSDEQRIGALSKLAGQPQARMHQVEVNGKVYEVEEKHLSSMLNTGANYIGKKGSAYRDVGAGMLSREKATAYPAESAQQRLLHGAQTFKTLADARKLGAEIPTIAPQAEAARAATQALTRQRDAARGAEEARAARLLGEETRDVAESAGRQPLPLWEGGPEYLLSADQALKLATAKEKRRIGGEPTPSERLAERKFDQKLREEVQGLHDVATREDLPPEDRFFNAQEFNTRALPDETTVFISGEDDGGLFGRAFAVPVSTTLPLRKDGKQATMGDIDQAAQELGITRGEVLKMMQERGAFK